MAPTDISGLATRERGEVVLDVGLTYDRITPVLIRARKRQGRFEFSDDGGAVAAAGVDWRRLRFADSIAVGEYSVNVGRQGVVWLPGFAGSSERWLATLPGLVGEGSLMLYEALLEFDWCPKPVMPDTSAARRRSGSRHVRAEEKAFLHRS